jgi:hypothetical protein
MTAWWDPGWDDECPQQDNEELKDEAVSIPFPCSGCGNLKECLSGCDVSTCPYIGELDKVTSSKAFMKSEIREALNGCRGIFIAIIIIAIIIAIVLCVSL